MLKRVLRGIVGRHAGAVYVLDARTSIGRAADADIQVLGADVSRQHAKIVVSSDGRMLVVDLLSKSGTRVDDEQVHRHVLRPGETLMIGDALYVYEEVTGPVVTAPIYSARERSHDSLRQTDTIPAVGGLLPRSERPTKESSIAEDGVLPPAVAEIHAAPQERVYDSTPPGGIRYGVSMVSAWDAEDAVPYAPGSEPPPSYWTAAAPPEELAVLVKVLDYRELRLRLLQGEALGKVDKVRYGTLQRTLRDRAIEGAGVQFHNRQYQRFACALPALLTRRHGERVKTTAVALQDISAGGAKIATHQRLQDGDLAWLAIDLSRADAARRTVVFKSRVVWTSAGADVQHGLIFAGAARYGHDPTAVIEG